MLAVVARLVPFTGCDCRKGGEKEEMGKARKIGVIGDGVAERLASGL